MLSGFVNKYLNERHTFNTDVCSYTFGLGGRREESGPDMQMETTLELQK